MENKRKKLRLLICCLVLAALIFAACGARGEIYFVSDGITVHYIATNGKCSLTLPDAASKNGWIFDGWVTSDGEVFHEKYFAEKRLTGAFFVYASWREDTGVKGTDIIIEGASKTSATGYALVVSNLQESVRLYDLITVDSSSSCRVTYDEAGAFNVGESAALASGSNLFFIWVTARDGQAVRYRLEVKRNILFKVEYFEDGVLQLQQFVEEGNLPQPPEWSKKGFHLVWDKDLTVAVTSDTEVNAMWVPKTVTITFDGNGGEGTVAAVSALCGQNILLPECGFKNTGFVFAGWSDGQNVFSESAFFEVPATDETFIKFTAVWDAASIEVKFESNGGDGETGSIFVYANTPVKADSEFTKYGYDFTGWNTQPDGSGDSYDAEELILQFSGDVVVLYAQWTEKDVHIVFSSEAGGGERREYYIKGGTETELPQNWYSIDGYEFVCWAVLLEKDYFYDEGATFSIPVTENRIYITPVFREIIE